MIQISNWSKLTKFPVSQGRCWRSTFWYSTIGNFKNPYIIINQDILPVLSDHTSAHLSSYILHLNPSFLPLHNNRFNFIMDLMFLTLSVFRYLWKKSSLLTFLITIDSILLLLSMSSHVCSWVSPMALSCWLNYYYYIDQSPFRISKSLSWSTDSSYSQKPKFRSQEPAAGPWPHKLSPP
jgi:hypothetical protein